MSNIDFNRIVSSYTDDHCSEFDNTPGQQARIGLNQAGNIVTYVVDGNQFHPESYRMEYDELGRMTTCVYGDRLSNSRSYTVRYIADNHWVKTYGENESIPEEQKTTVVGNLKVVEMQMKVGFEKVVRIVETFFVTSVFSMQLSRIVDDNPKDSRSYVNLYGLRWQLVSCTHAEDPKHKDSFVVKREDGYEYRVYSENPNDPRSRHPLERADEPSLREEFESGYSRVAVGSVQLLGLPPNKG